MSLTPSPPFMSPDPTGGLDPNFPDDPYGWGGPPIIVINQPVPDLSSTRNAISALGGAITIVRDIVGLLASAVGQLLVALGAIWTILHDTILPLFQRLIEKIKRIVDLIRKYVVPALRAYRKAILDFYNKFLRPLIVIIQDIRRVIAIFRLLHIHVLDGLDKKLAQLEGKLLKPIYAALYRVNTLSNWLSFLLNSHFLLWRGLFLGSFSQNIGGAFNLLAQAPAYGFTALPQIDTTATPVPVAPITRAQVEASFTAALPAVAARVAHTPASDLVACWKQPVGNVDLSSAIENLWACLTS